MWMRQILRWAVLLAATAAVTVPLTLVGVPSAALFAALVVGIVLALMAKGPGRVPRKLGLGAQGVLGVYIGTMVQQDALAALGGDWPIVIGIAVATLLLSVIAGVLLGLYRDVTPLTGSLALTAGGASGLVAIARELGGDDRVVAVVQYLRVALVTASMPVVVTLIYHADKSRPDAATVPIDQAPWYLSVGMVIVLVLVGATAGRLIRLPGAGLLGPLALTVAL
ncbi:MAG: AbrB family transcriptional regulator, partial [Mycobacterium sp.]|nr:AbrB family transcriptional regulator [Mycobacterium sp.]